MYDPFNCLDYLHPVSPEMKRYLEAIVKRRKISKYSYLLKAGEYPDKVWFVEKGLIRCFYNYEEKEVTMWFVNEGRLIPSGNLFGHASNPVYLQALENSSITFAEQGEVMYIQEHFSEAAALKMEITKWYAHLLSLRLQCTSMQTPKERYRYFLQHLSFLQKRITLDIMASYLDISKRTLIRLMHE